MSFNNLSSLLVCLTLISVLLTSCDKDGNNAGCSGAGSFTCKVDGQNYTGTSFTNTLFRGTDATYNIDAKRLDISVRDDNGNRVAIAVSDYKDGAVGEGFQVKKYYIFSNAQFGDCDTIGAFTYVCSGALGYYYPASSSNVYIASGGFDDDSTQHVTITANDATNHTISGTFKFTATRGFSDSVVITQGVFTDLCYTLTGN